MARIALSPSTQEWNRYANGTTEEAVMRALAALTKPYLIAAGHEVLICGTESWKASAAQSNNFHAHCHVAQHTNAGGGVGTEVWYHTGSVKGNKLAQCVYAEIAPVSSSPDRGVKASTNYGELNNTVAPAIIIEYDFHDRMANALEIISDLPQYAKETAEGILNYLALVGLSATPRPPATPTTPKPIVIPPTVRYGNSGYNVRKLQTLLNAKRKPLQRKLVIDGDFGDKTLARVRQFQKERKLAVDGVVGARTWKALMS